MVGVSVNVTVVEPGGDETVVKSVPMSEAAAAAMKQIDEAHLLLGPQSPDYFKGKSKTELFRIRETNSLRVSEVAEQFYRDHPTDPMRWEGILHMVMIKPMFVKEIKPGFEDAKGFDPSMLVIDREAEAAWSKRLEGYQAAMNQASDVPWEVLEKATCLAASRRLSAARVDKSYSPAMAQKEAAELAKRI